MSKGSKILIGFFIVCGIVTVASIILSIATKDKTQARNDANKENCQYNYELIKSEIFDPETQKFGAANEADTPDNLSELPYVVVRKYQNKGEDITWEYTASVSEVGDLK